MSQFNITQEIKGSDVYYRVHWSHFIRLSKDRIRRSIPSEAGLFQIFINRNGNLALKGTYQAYYGGLRSVFLEILDEDCQVPFPEKEMLREEETYIRFALTSSRDVLNDLMHHFAGKEDSERFNEILVEEKETMKIAR